MTYNYHWSTCTLDSAEYLANRYAQRAAHRFYLRISRLVTFSETPSSESRYAARSIKGQ